MKNEPYYIKEWSLVEACVIYRFYAKPDLIIFWHTLSSRFEGKYFLFGVWSYYSHRCRIVGMPIHYLRLPKKTPLCSSTDQ